MNVFDVEYGIYFTCETGCIYISKFTFTFIPTCLTLETNSIFNLKRFIEYPVCDVFRIKETLGVCFVLTSWKEYLFLFTYLITLGKDVTFPLITKFKQTCIWVIYLYIEYQIKMRPHQLHLFKPVLNLYFRFEFLIRKLDNSLCTSLNIRLKRIQIDTHKNLIRY